MMKNNQVNEIFEGTLKALAGIYQSDAYDRENDRSGDREMSDDYDRNEEGEIISCCGDVVDEDIMICPTCKEHQ